ncbi:MAG: PEGA domain-containing protein [Myxococcaceae bacterium]|nr:PEGA domain-containing protein [Myxococcaceae bacterium]
MPIALVSCVALLLASAEERPPLVVLEPEVKGASPVEAAGVVNAIAAGAREVDAFSVLSPTDLRALLSVERQKQLVGLGGETSVALQALGARHAIASTLTKAGDGLRAELRLLDVESGKVLSQRGVPEAKTLAALTVALPGLTQEALAPLLAEQLGQLLVRSSEDAADVLVDDKLLGSTPLLAPLAVPRGRHRVEVRKEGFIARKGSVTVQKGELAMVDLGLLPSPDFANAYRTRNLRLRIEAIAAGATAVAAITTAVVLDRFVAEPAYQNEFKPRADLLALANQTDTPAATGAVQERCAADLTACRADALGLQSRISSMQTVSVVLLGVGAAAAVGAVVCFVLGEDPNRYGRLSVGVAPAPGGGGALLVGGAL